MDFFLMVSIAITGILIILLIVVFIFRKKVVTKKLRYDAENGDLSSQLALAGYYFSLEPKDVEHGIFWLTKAADGGSIEAQTVLGTIYGDGSLVPQNKEESLKRFLAAAMGGSVFAQKTIAGVYHFSVGLDKKVAYAWYSVASASGDTHSKEMADKLMNEFVDADKIAAKDIALEYMKSYYLVRKK